MQVPLELTSQVFLEDMSNGRSGTQGSAWRSPLMSGSNSTNEADNRSRKKKSDKSRKKQRKPKARQAEGMGGSGSISDSAHDSILNKFVGSDHSTTSFASTWRGDSTINNNASLSSMDLEEAATRKMRRKSRKSYALDDETKSSKKKEDRRSRSSQTKKSNRDKDDTIGTNITDDETLGDSYPSFAEKYIVRTEHGNDPSVMLDLQTTTRDGKLRSAYDKSADWYCGPDADAENDVDSIHSDGSSVLSAFRIKKKKPIKVDLPANYFVTPPKGKGEVEESMHFSSLIGGSSNGMDDDSQMDSISLLQLEANHSRKKKKGTKKARKASLSTAMKELGPLQNIAFSQLLVEQRNRNEHSPDADPSPANVEDIESSTEKLERKIATSTDHVDDNDGNNNIGSNERKKKLSFLDRLTTKKSVLALVIGSGILIALNVILICIVLL